MQQRFKTSSLHIRLSLIPVEKNKEMQLQSFSTCNTLHTHYTTTDMHTQYIEYTKRVCAHAFMYLRMLYVLSHIYIVLYGVVCVYRYGSSYMPDIEIIPTSYQGTRGDVKNKTFITRHICSKQQKVSQSNNEQMLTMETEIFKCNICSDPHSCLKPNRQHCSHTHNCNHFYLHYLICLFIICHVFSDVNVKKYSFNSKTYLTLVYIQICNTYLQKCGFHDTKFI